MGALAKRISHDPAINPDARPYGSPEEETIAFGEALTHLYMTAFARGIDPDKGLELALNRIKTDWRKQQGVEGKVIGSTDWRGQTQGKAYVVSPRRRLNKFKSGILVLSHAEADIIEYFENAYGIVTDHGGKTSHLAVHARQQGVPYIVGTEHATELIQHGSTVTMKGDGKKGEVYV